MSMKKVLQKLQVQKVEVGKHSASLVIELNGRDDATAMIGFVVPLPAALTV